MKDSYGNSAQNQANFTSTSSPAISGFSPASGVPGTQVTITGINFSTTPANNIVTFTGSATPAPVLSATATQLVVTVPAGAGAMTGPISVAVTPKSGSSSAQFTVLPTISLGGTVKDSSGTTLSGATIQLPGNTLVTTTSDVSGNFTLNGLPSGQDFAVKVSLAGYADTYSGILNSSTNITGRDFTLYLAGQLSTWGVTPGKGAIRGRVLNSADVSSLSGATVTITSPTGSGYSVVYANAASGNPDGSLTSTSTNGLFYILNVTPGTMVTVSASKSGFTFPERSYYVFADSVSQGSISGTDFAPPVITAFTMPTSADSTTVAITSFTATDNSGTVTGYLVTESATAPNPADLGGTGTAGELHFWRHRIAHRICLGTGCGG